MVAVRTIALLQQPLAHSIRTGLGPVLQMELLQDVAQVDFHSVLGDEKRRGDLAIGIALGDELEDICLAGGQRFARRHGRRRGAFTMPELLQDFGRQHAGHGRFATAYPSSISNNWSGSMFFRR